MAVGVASVWCVVAAVSVDAGESLASGAAFLFAKESSGGDEDGLGCKWKRFGMICEAASDDASVETASRM